MRRAAFVSCRAVTVLSLVLAACSGHAAAPTLDAPAVTLSPWPNTCTVFTDLRPTSVEVGDVVWNDGEAPAASERFGQTSMDFSVDGTDIAVGTKGYTGWLSATGDLTWESVRWPMEFSRIVVAGEVLVSKMYWHHSVGIGDEPGDSARVMTGIDLETGRMLWWIPQEGGGYRDLVAADSQSLVLRDQLDSRNCSYLSVVETRTGVERWNTSVPSCELKNNCSLDAIALTENYLFARVTSAGTSLTVAWDIRTGAPA